MPTLLENITETHDGPEPRVLAEDLEAVLRRVVRPGEDAGAAVTLIAQRSGLSTRTVYRALKPDPDKPTVSLDTADRLCVAAGVHISFACRLVWPDGSVTGYVSD